MKEYFKNICKLALDMTFRKQQVVSESQINFPLSPPNSDKGSLGLFTVVNCAMNCTVCNYMSVVCRIVVYYRIPLCT